MAAPEYGGISAGAIVTVTKFVTGYAANGVLPSLGIDCVTPVAAVVGSAGPAGVTEVPSAGATGVITGATTGTPFTVTGATASGVDVASPVATTGVTAAAAAAVAVDDSPGFCSPPWLMIVTLSPLGFNAPYKARPPTPASRALWNGKLILCVSRVDYKLLQLMYK